MKSVLSTAEALQLLGLGPAWATAIEGELMQAGASAGPGRWLKPAVRGWARRVLADSDHFTLHQYRLVAMRMANLPTSVVKDRAGTKPNRPVLHRTALMIALRYTHDVAPRRQGRTGDLLARQGMPARGTLNAVTRREVVALWRSGVSRDEILTMTNIGATALARLMPELPCRLTS